MPATPAKLAVELSLLGLLALLWGSSYLLIKIAVVDIPPLTLIATRVAIAALFLSLIVIWQKDRFPRDARTWGRLLIQSFFNSLGAWTILAWGQQHIDSGLASVLNSTSPIFILLFTIIVKRGGNIGLLKPGGAILGIVGVALIVGPDVLAGLGDQIAGQLAVLSGAILYAGAAIYGRKFAHLAPCVSAAATMIWASVFLLPAALLIDQSWQLEPSANAMLAAVFLAVVCTAIALLIYFRLLRTLGAIGVASQSYLRAGIGILLGVGLLGEALTLPALIGIFAVLLGVIALNLEPLSCRTKPSEFNPPVSPQKEELS